jgi:hypothetical protein
MRNTFTRRSLDLPVVPLSTFVVLTRLPLLSVKAQYGKQKKQSTQTRRLRPTPASNASARSWSVRRRSVGTHACTDEVEHGWLAARRRCACSGGGASVLIVVSTRSRTLFTQVVLAPLGNRPLGNRPSPGLPRLLPPALCITPPPVGRSQWNPRGADAAGSILVHWSAGAREPGVSWFAAAATARAARRNPLRLVATFAVHLLVHRDNTRVRAEQLLLRGATRLSRAGESACAVR